MTAAPPPRPLQLAVLGLLAALTVAAFVYAGATVAVTFRSRARISRNQQNVHSDVLLHRTADKGVMPPQRALLWPAGTTPNSVSPTTAAVSAPKIRHGPICRPATCSELCGRPGKWGCGTGCGANTEPNRACCTCSGCTVGGCSHDTLGANLQQDPTASYSVLHLSHAHQQDGLHVNGSVPAKHAVCGIDGHLLPPLGQMIHRASSYERLGVVAEMHYEKRRPIVLGVADKFALHPHLREWPLASASRRTDYTSLVTARMANMGAKLRERGRDDFRVEKDKCEMYRFFGRASQLSCETCTLAQPTRASPRGPSF